MRYAKSVRHISLIAAICCCIPTSFAQVQNDQGNYFGDNIRLSVDVPATLRDKTDEKHCIPAGTQMKVIGQEDKTLIVKLEVGDSALGCAADKLSPNFAYVLTRDDVSKSGPARTGVTYGALVVPFKYQISGNKDFTGSASVGGYVGYRFQSLHRLGITATPIAFAGASDISVPGTSGASSTNVMGFSYGLGLIATFKDAFQLGGVVGWDRVGASTGYQYNGKPWIALEIGYAFLQ